jgi:glutaredoxin 3
MRFQVYLTEFCPYCVMARQLLDQLGYPFDEIRVDLDPEQRRVMLERSGRTSVPQIFIGTTHVGGYDDLSAMHRSGALASLVAEATGDAA